MKAKRKPENKVLGFQRKREYTAIRLALLKSLAGGQKNLNALAKASKVNWKTTRNHMIYLMGMSYVKLIFASPQVKIYEITEYGLFNIGSAIM